MHPTSDERIVRGDWVRADRYKVKDGFISPVEGSALRSYDPWSAYKPPRGKETRKQPYHSLLDLVSRIDGGELDHEARDLAIAEWYGRHGPLGVVPERGRDKATASVFEYHPEFTMSEMSLADNLHSEPVETFLIAGRFLRRLVDQLQATRDSKKSLNHKQIEFQIHTQGLIAVLSGPRIVMFVDAKGHYALRWECYSLMSHFMTMVLLDFANSRPLVCQNSKCRSFFVTKSTQAKYCSGRCRDAVQMRRHRKRIARNAKGNTK